MKIKLTKKQIRKVLSECYQVYPMEMKPYKTALTMPLSVRVLIAFNDRYEIGCFDYDLKEWRVNGDPITEQNGTKLIDSNGFFSWKYIEKF